MSRATHTATPQAVYDSSLRPPVFFEELRELYRYRDLVRLWSARNVTLRYKRSALGVLWTLLEPLMLMVILSVVFSTLFRFQLENYPVYILAGLIVFDFFSRSTTQMVDEIIASQNLAQRIYLPRSAFAVAAIASYLFNWLLALVPLLAIMLVLGHDFSWTLLLVPMAMLVNALFAIGVGLVVATLGAFFLDIKLTYHVLLNALFYATPIFYPMAIVPESYRFLFKLNPMYHLVGLFRRLVYEGEVGTWTGWAVCLVIGLVSAGVGWALFTRSRRVFEYRV